AELTRQAGQFGGAIDGQGRITLGRQDFIGCGPGSCTITVGFTNQAAGPTRVALHADWDGAARPIGGCDSTSEPVPGHHTGTLTCTPTPPPPPPSHQPPPPTA